VDPEHQRGPWRRPGLQRQPEARRRLVVRRPAGLRRQPAPGRLAIRNGQVAARRAAQQAADQQKAFDAYVRQTAGASGDTTADQLSKLADLKSKGVITDAEFDAQKAKILAS